MNLEPLLPAPRTIAPGWNAPDSVHALFTLREGGVSKGPWGGAGGDRGFNVGSRCGDDPAAVKRNRESLILVAGTAPRWLHQVHGTRIVRAEDAAEEEEADGSWTTAKGVVLAIQTADCLPVVITDEEGSVLVALHAGWRGLSAGILQEGVRTALLHRASPEAGLIAWLAPRIGTESFEVGEDVLRAMESKIPDARSAFVPEPGKPGKFFADLGLLARKALIAAGVPDACIFDSRLSTAADPVRFYSYRRDKGRTGRHVTLAWLSPSRASQKP